ncbi:Survival of motor neuron-related-splicing factor 30 [Lentinula edodes]|uniref:Survival of motor neuron-related-splicing factor 30 n=1 Tax=Lentinula edodes TaxID=5353 RepID=A0A1Q3E1Y6_LENED|nr:Survival of motor neuron-related-splicing factor 30 [Lentinula edodes]
MDRTDLETYQVQLSQVDTALQAEPANAELASLRAELQELIALTQTALAQAAEGSSSKVESSRKTASIPSLAWSAGDECMAKYEQAKPSDLKPLPVSYTSTVSATKRKHETDDEKERKKKKNEKKLETRAAKAKEQNHKQATWQKFAKKSEKKGVHIAGVSGTSIFKTPDNPLGKGEHRPYTPDVTIHLLKSLLFVESESLDTSLRRLKMTIHKLLRSR